MKIELYPNDFESPEVFEQKFPTAKKEHTCCECGEKINPGEKYENAFCVWSGEARRYKRCYKCVEINTFVYGGMCPYGGMAEMLWNDFMCAGVTQNDCSDLPVNILDYLEPYFYKGGLDEN